MDFEYKFDVSIGSKTFKCRAFTLGEYKDLMKAKADGNIKDTVLDILNKCTNARNLTKQESEMLLVKLWAHSTGEVNINTVYTCECEKEILVPINMNYIQLDDVQDIIYDFKNFKIKFKYPKIFEDSNKALMVASCIDYIIVGDEKLKVDDLTEQELSDLYTAITTEDMIKISDMLVNPTIYMAIPIQCECGKSHIKVIKGLKEFFRLL